MNSTDGLVRGVKAVDTGGPITVPVGEECLGRVFNLLGDPVDNKPRLKQRRDGQFTVRHLPMRNRLLRQKFWRQELK